MMTAEEYLTGMLPEQDREKLSAEMRDTLLDVAGEKILNRMYPFGYEQGTEVPHRYIHLQAQIALELFNRQGAEGEVSRQEGDAGRWAYESADVSDSLMRKIIPFASGVIIR